MVILQPVSQAEILLAAGAAGLVAQAQLLLAACHAAAGLLCPLLPQLWVAAIPHMCLKGSIHILSLFEVNAALADGAEDDSAVPARCTRAAVGCVAAVLQAEDAVTGITLEGQKVCAREKGREGMRARERGSQMRKHLKREPVTARPCGA